MVIALIGPSGSGKDSIAKVLKSKLDFDFIVLHSSRPKRDDEKEGDPYFFVSKNGFEDFIKNNELIEYRSYNTFFDNKNDVWYYGIHKSSIHKETNYIATNTLEGLINLKKEFKNIKSFYLNVSDEVRTERAKLRNNFDLQEWNRRLIADKKDFENYELYCDYVVDNIDFDDTINKILTLLDNKGI